MSILNSKHVKKIEKFTCTIYYEDKIKYKKRHVFSFYYSLRSFLSVFLG